MSTHLPTTLHMSSPVLSTAARLHSHKKSTMTLEVSFVRKTWIFSSEQMKTLGFISWVGPRRVFVLSLSVPQRTDTEYPLALMLNVCLPVGLRKRVFLVPTMCVFLPYCSFTPTYCLTVPTYLSTLSFPWQSVPCVCVGIPELHVIS